jgi:hypothetical protein
VSEVKRRSTGRKEERTKCNGDEHYGPSPHRSGPSSPNTVREKRGDHREGLPDPGQGRGVDVYATSRLHELNS